MHSLSWTHDKCPRLRSSSARIKYNIMRAINLHSLVFLRWNWSKTKLEGEIMELPLNNKNGETLNKFWEILHENIYLDAGMKYDVYGESLVTTEWTEEQIKRMDERALTDSIAVFFFRKITQQSRQVRERGGSHSSWNDRQQHSGHSWSKDDW